MFTRKFLFSFAILLSPALPAFCADTSKASARCPQVSVISSEDKVRIELNGQLFTEYHFKGAPHVYFFPLLGPGNVPMTRNAPMKEMDGEDRDHPHHRSLWFSHGAVNGIDFWSEAPKAGKIVHDRILSATCDARGGALKTSHKWIAPDEKTICTDETTFRVYPDGQVRTFDFDVTLKASEGMDVTLGDTKEGTMGIRLAESMRLAPNKFNTGKPTGHIVQSTGVRDEKTWGKAAEWCDYYGPIEGKILGVAIFDHPKNLRHPTTWHVRDYGLFAANPFGLHDFEKKPEDAGNFTIKSGQSVTFRYRFVLHEGDEKQAGIARLYQQYASENLSK